MHFLKLNLIVLIKIALMFVADGPLDENSAVVPWVCLGEFNGFRCYDYSVKY